MRAPRRPQLGLAALAVVSACTRKGAPGLTLAGSTSIQPFAETWAEAYGATHAGAVIHVQGGGPREQEVLRRRFGLDGERESTLLEIATSLSLSRERVRQIEAQALGRLQAPSRSLGLDAHLAD